MFDIPLPIYFSIKEHPLKTSNKRTHVPPLLINQFVCLTILTGKDWCFNGMAGWLLLIFLIWLHNQLSSIHSIISKDV